MENQKMNPNKKTVLSALAWAAAYIGSLLVMTQAELSKPAGLVLAFIPIILFVVFIVFYIGSFSAMDEVKQRVQFEAVVIAFSLSLLLVMSLFLIGMVVEINYDYFGYALMVLYFIAFYYIGYIVSKRKYGS